MFDRVFRSFELARSSWDVLANNAKLLIFPIVSGASCLLVLVSFFIPVVVCHDLWLTPLLQIQPGHHVDPDAAREAFQPPVWFWAGVFLFYFINYFIIIFFNSALVACALVDFNGGRVTVVDGLKTAWSRLPQILAWSAVSATVGLLLKWIESSNDRVGRFISSILGTGWTVMTFFVVPVMVVEGVGPAEAVSRSVSILRQTWGEALIGQIGLGFVNALLGLPGVGVMVGGIVLSFQFLPLGLLLIAVGFTLILLGAAVSAALEGIYLSAMYHYARVGAAPTGFDTGLLSGAFRSRGY